MSQDRIKVLSGKLKDREYSIEGVISIGRTPDNTIALDDRQVSRKHASVEPGANGPVLKDLGSGNGTFVEGKRVLECELAADQRFRCGAVEMHFVAGNGA